MSQRAFGVLVHGAGWVSGQHIAAFQQNSASRVVAISSRRLETARRRARESGLGDIPCYDNFEQALRHPGVDIVSICTPQHVHCENVLAAARAGKHLVIEKPVGISLEELQRMREAVRRADVRTVVSFVLRWNPLFRKLKALVAQGAIGQPYSVEADYLSHNGSWWSGWADTCSRSHGVSAMLVAGCHAIDALRWFAATEEFQAADPVEVMAMAGGYRKGRRAEYHPQTHTWVSGAPPMEYDGLELALVKFANGVVGKVSVNFDCIMPYRFPVRLFGDRGSIFDNRLWSHTIPEQKQWMELPDIQPESSDVSHHPFQAQMDHFLDCLQRGVESHCNLEDAIKTHEVAFAVLESSRINEPVRLPMLQEAGPPAPTLK
jgi:predicted dehydrogenase